MWSDLIDELLLHYAIEVNHYVAKDDHIKLCREWIRGLKEIESREVDAIANVLGRTLQPALAAS